MTKSVLQIGYRAMLKGSQSISDLSYIPDKEPNIRGVVVSGRGEFFEESRDLVLKVSCFLL